MIWLRIAKPQAIQALGHRAGMKRAVPDVGDGAGEQRPGLAPVGPVVVQHLAVRSVRLAPCPVAPGRVVLDAIGRIRAMSCGSTPPSRRATSPASVASPQSTRCGPHQPEIAGRDTGSDRRSRVSSSRGSARSPWRRSSISPASKPRADEVDAEFGKLACFERQHLGVPASTLGELVVGEDQRPLLRRAEMRQLDHRHLGEPELARGQEPAMPGDDAVLAIDEQRRGEAELADRAGDQRHLRLRVGAGIAGVGDRAHRPAGARCAARDRRGDRWSGRTRAFMLGDPHRTGASDRGVGRLFPRLPRG